MLKDDVIGLLGRILEAEEFDPRFKKPNRVSDAPLASPVVQARETIPMKPLSLSELEGYPYLTTMSDRTAAGGQLVGVGDKSLAYPVNLTGGQDFMRDFTENPNLWASAEGVVPKMVTAARELEGEYGRQPVFMPWSMTPTGSDFSGMTGKTMFSYASENMPQTFKKEVDAHMKLYVPDWKGIDNPESGSQFDALPDKARKKVQGYMDTKFRNVGGITLPQTRIAIADQSQLNQPVMGFKNVGLIDTSVDALAGAGNPTYPSALAGKYMGTLDTDVTAIDLNPNRYARKKNADGSFFEDPQGKDFLSMKTAPRRSMETNYYGGLIDEPLLRSLEDRGFKVKSGLLPTAATLGTAAMSLLGSEEADASGLVSAVPAIARKMLDDPNAPKKNTPQGWANYLKNNGAKPNEIEKYNLDLIDSKRPLGKEEVSQYLLDNEYKFGRSLHTEQPNQTDVDVMREQHKDYFDEKMSTYGATKADVNEEIGGLLDEKQPLFRTDRSSGDITNYRNQVLTDPSGEQIDKYIGMNTQRSTQLSGELIELNNAIDNESFILDNVDGNLVKVPMEEMIARRTKLQTDKARLELLRNQAENRLFVESSHFTEPNAIGHVRTTDRVNSFDPRTGKKTEYRLMEEVQSDWVQRAENPDYGVKDIEAMDNLYDAMYESKVNQYKAMANASPDEKEGIFNDYLAEQADISRRLDSMNRSKEGLALVPQPPVAKPHIPLINQTIIDAVDDNMDGVGIVTGDTQLAAKDQFQFINDISWKSVKSDGDATEILFDFSGITNRQGDVGTVHQQLSMDIKKDLEAFRTMMPKGAADQIINDVKAAVERGDDSGVMSNFNTQVEGKKLRPYYNKTLRKHLEQIGKQYGVKVERRANTDEYRIDDLDDGDYAVVRDGDVIEEFNDIDEAKQYLSKQQMGADDHFYLPFTDEMKADVKKNGLKMFSAFGLTPVAIDAMRSNVNAEDERMRVVYDDTDTQREENRAAIEDMLARDAKTRRREELGDTLTGLLDAPRTALNLAGDAVTGLVSDAATIPSLFVSAYEKATPTEADAGMGQRYGDKMKQLVEMGMSLSPMGLMNLGKGDTTKEELIKQKIGKNVNNALQASAPYLRDAYTHEGLLGAPSIQDIVQATQQGYQSLPEGYLKDNALPAAGLSALGVLGMYDVLGLRRKAAQAAQQNMMPQGLLN